MRPFLDVHLYLQTSGFPLIVIHHVGSHLDRLKSVRLIQRRDHGEITVEQRRTEQAMALQGVGRLNRHSLTNTLFGEVLVSLNRQVFEGVALASIDIEDHKLTLVFFCQC